MTTGSCLCGTVHFSMDDEHSDMTHCHCSICRKLHGVPFATYVNVKNLQITKGESSIVPYESSPGFMRSFCGVCGSVLPEKLQGSATYSVPAGTINEDVDCSSQEHIFVESKAPWFEITDSLKQVEGYGEGDSRTIVDSPDIAATPEGYVAGSCQCGDVAFRFKDNAKFMMYCHCTRCRKVKGAAHAANVFVAPEDFEWLRGEDCVVAYDLPDAVRFGNSFCKTCGSSVPRKADSAPAYNVPAGILDDDPGVDSKGHIFTGSKSNWYEITDDKAQFEEMPDS